MTRVGSIIPQPRPVRVSGRNYNTRNGLRTREARDFIYSAAIALLCCDILSAACSAHFSKRYVDAGPRRKKADEVNGADEFELGACPRGSDAELYPCPLSMPLAPELDGRRSQDCSEDDLQETRRGIGR